MKDLSIMNSTETAKIPQDGSIPPHCAEDLITPIDHDVAQRLVVFLLAHGAKVRQLNVNTYIARLPGGQMVEKLSSDHLVQFPTGSLQYDGLVLAHSMSFRIVFPDGFWLRGASTWGLGEEKRQFSICPKRTL